MATRYTLATTAQTQTLTNKTLTSPVLNTGVSGTAILDEDAMGSDSATKVATQQSIKAYVDSGTVTMTNKTLESPILTGTTKPNLLQSNNYESTVNSGVTTTLFTMPSDKIHTYLVTADINFAGDAPTYRAFAIICTGGATAKIMMQENGSLLTITLSGMAIRCRQASGISQKIRLQVVRIGA